MELSVRRSNRSYMSNGVFLVLEGGEGAGKSTQVDELRSRLEAAGYPAVFLQEPGGTPIAEHVRRTIKGQTDLTAEEELRLLCGARESLVSERIRPALRAGMIVVCDRYSPSSVAYQGYGRGIDTGIVRQANARATGGLFPDLVVLLDIDPQTGFARKATELLDRIEKAGMDFHSKVREGYLEQAHAEPDQWLVLDATGNQDSIAKKIWERVTELIGERRV